MKGVLCPALEMFWQKLFFGALLYEIFQFSLQKEDTADIYILKLTYKPMKLSHLKFFYLCFCLSLSSLVPVFNFPMNPCGQPLHCTSSWQIKHRLWEVMLMHKQSRRRVVLCSNPASFSSLFSLPSQMLIKTAFLPNVGQVSQPWTSHMATDYNISCQISYYILSEHVVFRDVDLSQLELRKHSFFLPLTITIHPSGQILVL